MGAREGDASTSFHLRASCTIIQNSDLKLYTSAQVRTALGGKPEFVDCVVDLNIFNKEENEDEIPNPLSVKSPLGAIAYCEMGDRLDAQFLSAAIITIMEGNEAPALDFLDARLYLDGTAFNDLWSRHQQGSSMPTVANICIKDVEFIDDGQYGWDTTKRPQLPIVQYQFKSETRMPETD